MTQQARSVALTVDYNGKDISGPLSNSLINFAYTDNYSGQLDDLQITVEDGDGRWLGSWQPTEGDRITARIKTINWSGPNDFKFLPCGVFEVDSADFSGPPDAVQIKANSLPGGTGARREKRSKAWEKIRLQNIAADIAARAGLKLLFEASDNPLYDRLDQTEQTDLGFLLELCKREGIALKVANGQLVMFDEAVYERKAAVATITKGVDAISNYSFSWSSTDAAYRACELTYHNASKKRTIKVIYKPPGAPAGGPVLKINESVDSEAEGLRVTRKRLREQNKNFGRGSLSLAGDVRMAAGLTINIKGWGRNDGKYIIELAKHSVSGSGYTTNISIRKVLGW